MARIAHRDRVDLHINKYNQINISNISTQLPKQTTHQERSMRKVLLAEHLRWPQYTSVRNITDDLNQKGFKSKSKSDFDFDLNHLEINDLKPRFTAV